MLELDTSGCQYLSIVPTEIFAHSCASTEDGNPASRISLSPSVRPPTAPNLVSKDFIKGACLLCVKDLGHLLLDLHSFYLLLHYVIHLICWTWPQMTGFWGVGKDLCFSQQILPE